MMCYEPREQSPVRFRPVERLDLHVRERTWKEPTVDLLQIGAIGLLSLMAPTSTKLINALKTAVTVAENESVRGINLAAACAQYSELQTERCAPSASQKINKEEQSHDILVYGYDANKIQSLVGACLQEAVPSRVPRITLNGSTLKTTTSTGLRTILESKYRALNEPQIVLIVLEDFSEEMIVKFESSGFREKCRSRGVSAVVVAWTCMQKRKSIDVNLLTPFTTKVFVPSSEYGRPEQGESQSSASERAASASTPTPRSNRQGMEEHQEIAETTLTTKASVPAGTTNTNLEKSDVVYFANRSGAKTTVPSDVGLVGHSNALPFPSNGNETLPKPLLTPAESLRENPASMRNDGMQIQKSIFYQPRANMSSTVHFSRETPATILSTAAAKQLKEEKEEETQNETVWERFAVCCAGCCAAVFE
ncbi:unnamed protein product [Orchesella dallaii]|uniref:Uncharacterized protein n=1 Tax=Orchesella dallaii TaxID=48710 RepID=A0ABP1QF55_9HEXA